ncbi:MAG: phosphate propanoyltransferase [Desulfobacteraceae bacterium]|nr:phosphate propanoyltransferase [Desulfobacteraceae bacterium]
MDEKIVELIMGELKKRLGEEVKTTIPVELSAKHVHLSEEDSIALFGEPLTYKRELSQPGQYLCDQRVRLIGPKGVIDNVAVLGPARSESQVEISISDSRALGLKTPIRQSGDIEGTPGIVLASSKGIVGLEQGVIVAGRHIHMSPADAERLNVKDKDLVCVNMTGTRPVIFRDVLVRVSKDFNLAMHIDFDEGNGSGWTPASECTIVRQPREEFCGA